MHPTFEQHHQFRDEVCSINLSRCTWLLRGTSALLLVHGILLWYLHRQLWPLLGMLAWSAALGGISVLSPRFQLQHRQAIGKFWVALTALLWLLTGSICAHVWFSATSAPGATPNVWVAIGVLGLLLMHLSLGLTLLLPPTTLSLLQAVHYGLLAAAEPLLANTLLHGVGLIYSVVCVLTSIGIGTLVWHMALQLLDTRHQLRKSQDETQMRQRELERLTRHDALTNTYNRAALQELCRQELARARRQMSNTTLLLIDLDHFKRINDTWGHPAGDAVLKHVASLVCRTVRSTDLVARLGGEEFVVLAPATVAQAALILGEKLRQRLQASPVVWNDETIHVTMSIGLAECTASSGADFAALYAAADAALYQAKAQGRNRLITSPCINKPAPT